MRTKHKYRRLYSLFNICFTSRSNKLCGPLKMSLWATTRSC